MTQLATFRAFGDRPVLRRLTAMLVTVAAGCGLAPDDRRPPDIVLISLDTLRRDHVGHYRPEQPSLTPNLDSFAASAVVFDRAYAQIPFTLPSHISMFTGLYPDVHGVDRKRRRLAGHVATLPEGLRLAGYDTVGLVTNLWMKGDFGFARGFDHYERLPYALTYADRVNARAFELLDARGEGDRPLFLFLHYIDPHSDFFKVGRNALPYYAPPEYLAGLDIEIDGDEFCDGDGHCATDFLLTADRQDRAVPAATIERVAALYGAGVKYLDDELGRLFDGLQQRDLWQDAVVMVTSDHGEEFREHGRFIHVQPFVENLAIPLMIKLPGNARAGTTVGCIAETVDYLPTLLELAGADHTELGQGTSLLPAIAGDTECAGTTFGRDKLNRSRFSLRTQDHALVHDLEAGSDELFALGDDPDELEDIGADHPELVDEMRARLLQTVDENRRLAAALRAASDDTAAVLTEEERERLRAIGYVD